MTPLHQGQRGPYGSLTKNGGVWRGTATKAGQSAQIWLDYKGNVGQGSAITSREGGRAGGGVPRHGAASCCPTVNFTL